MADQRNTLLLDRTLATRAALMLGLVALLLWGAWVSREITRPRQNIVTVRLAETIAKFVNGEARASGGNEISQQHALAFLEASQRAVSAMGKDGRIVLVAEAVLAGNAEDATAELEARIAQQLGQETGQ